MSETIHQPPKRSAAAGNRRIVVRPGDGPREPRVIRNPRRASAY